MSRQRKSPSKLGRAVQKYSVSAFVIGSFAAYALHERALNPDSAPTAALASPNAVVQQAASAPAPAAQAQALPTRTAPSAASRPTAANQTLTINQPQPANAPAQAASQPQTVAANQLRDGKFDGPVVDAYYGDVQVEATIKAGRIIDVQFLNYPHDRRTSQRINTVAMPYLMKEAIKAQSARVDVISGATLTSEAFAQSLQHALDSARG